MSFLCAIISTSQILQYAYSLPDFVLFDLTSHSLKQGISSQVDENLLHFSYFVCQDIFVTTSLFFFFPENLFMFPCPNFSPTILFTSASDSVFSESLVSVVVSEVFSQVSFERTSELLVSSQTDELTVCFSLSIYPFFSEKLHNIVREHQKPKLASYQVLF